MKRIFIVASLVVIFNAQAGEEIPPEKPKIGNYAHDLTPFNTFAFGQNIYNANTFLLFPSLSQCGGKNFSEVELVPAVLYSPTDSFSIYVGLPVVLKDKSENITRRGIGDLVVQLEYGLIEYSTTQVEALVTIVGNVGLPTTHLKVTSDCMETTTNNPATNFLVGATASYLTAEWYVYSSFGGTFYTTRDNERIGDSILYEWGIGHNIIGNKALTMTGLLEFNGTYSRKDKSGNCKDPNSGGNILFAGPTVSLTGDRWALAGGIQLPIIQNLNGQQDKTKYRTGLLFTFRF